MVSSRIDPARLSHLIGLIYDAAIDTACWPVAMEAIRIELNCAAATLSLQRMPAGDVIINLATNIPQAFVDRIPDYAADVLDQWGGAERIMALPIGEPHVLSRVNPSAVDFERSTNRYTLEWGKPQGLNDVIAVGLARDAEALGSLAFGRHVDAGPIGTREEEIVRLLIPHLQRAATINRMLDLSAITKATFEAAIDTIAVPVLLTDDLMRIVYVNPAAQQVLDRGDMIVERNGLLGAASASVAQALKVAIEHASSDLAALGRKGLGIPVRSVGKSGALHVLPLRQGMALAPRAVVAVFVAHTGTPFVAPTEIVSALFGLTPAESRVFDRIVSSDSVADVATALGVGQSTVKTHMLRIYDKTGVKRRAELQQMASSLSLPIAG